jgi:hypothetical protein
MRAFLFLTLVPLGATRTFRASPRFAASLCRARLRHTRCSGAFLHDRARNSLVTPSRRAAPQLAALDDDIPRAQVVDHTTQVRTSLREIPLTVPQCPQTRTVLLPGLGVCRNSQGRNDRGYGTELHPAECRPKHLVSTGCRDVTSTTAPTATGWSESHRVGFAPTEGPCPCTAR